MAFTKGNKHGQGRPKGSNNKVTAAAREMFLEVMEGEIEHVQEQLDCLRRESSRDYLKALAAFLPYFLPKQAETEVTIIGPSHPPSWFDEVIEREGENSANVFVND